jgi:hypothetical protein
MKTMNNSLNNPNIDKFVCGKAEYQNINLKK